MVVSEWEEVVIESLWPRVGMMHTSEWVDAMVMSESKL